MSTLAPYTFRGMTLPANLKESIDAYILTGRPTGSFLQACIDNNLREACSRVDEDNRPIIPVIVAYLYNECPIFSWGYSGAHDAWIRRKREERER